MRNKRSIFDCLLLSLFVATSVFFYHSQAMAIADTDVEKEATPSNSFQIQPGDRLEVSVYREEDLSSIYEVDPAGKINFPLIGEIQAADLKIETFREQLVSRLKEYLINPQISISRAEGNIKSISILGRVDKPGVYDYIPGSTLMRLISTAGGFADSAQKKKIRIIRIIGGERKIVEINSEDIMKKGEKDPDIKPGDIIFVPESIF